MAATGRSSLRVCPHTGIAVPECSCTPCLQAQLREHMPSLLAQPRTIGEAPAVTPPSADHRAA